MAIPALQPFDRGYFIVSCSHLHFLFLQLVSSLFARSSLFSDFLFVGGLARARVTLLVMASRVRIPIPSNHIQHFWVASGEIKYTLYYKYLLLPTNNQPALLQTYDTTKAVEARETTGAPPRIGTY
jgi:hypothetical protein